MRLPDGVRSVAVLEGCPSSIPTRSRSQSKLWDIFNPANGYSQFFIEAADVLTEPRFEAIGHRHGSISTTNDVKSVLVCGFLWG